MSSCLFSLPEAVNGAGWAFDINWIRSGKKYNFKENIEFLKYKFSVFTYWIHSTEIVLYNYKWFYGKVKKPRIFQIEFLHKSISINV